MTRGEGLLAVLVGALATCACGQPCEPSLSEQFASGHFGPGSQFYGESRALYAWDRAGEHLLVAGGDFFHAGGAPAKSIAVWDGFRWQGLGEGVEPVGYQQPGVRAIIAFDPDGDGPLGERLIAAGSFLSPDTPGADHIAEWDGSLWRSLGGGADDTIDALEVYDEDGPGPLPLRLIVSGRFTEIGGIAAGGIAAWDGEDWTPLLRANIGQFYDLAVFDEDGHGGEPPALFGAGWIDNPDYGFIWGIARYRDGVWSAVDRVIGAGDALAVIDPDGDGPTGDWLVLGGAIRGAGGESANNLAAWDGQRWHTQSLWSSEVGTVEALATLPAGFGGADVPTLAIAADGVGVIVWRDGEWTPTNLDRFPPDQVAGGVALDGSRDPRLYATGKTGVYEWNGLEWALVSNGPSPVHTAIAFPSTPGHNDPPTLVLAGHAIELPGEAAKQSVVAWDGRAWLEPFPGLINAGDIVLWDIPGDGTDEPALVAAGSLSVDGWQGPILAAAWVEDAWIPVGEVPSRVDNFRPSRAAIHDFDGQGGDPSTMVLLGEGYWRDGDDYGWDSVMVLEDGAWRPLGEQLGTDDIPPTCVVSYDPDASGPLRPSLIVGGRFRDYQGVALNGIAEWDGSGWAPVGGGFEEPTDVHAMLVVAEAGENPALYIACDPGVIGGVPVQAIAAWDGQRWQALPGDFDDEVNELGVVDGELLGVAGRVLVASGPFTEVDGIPCRGAAFYDGTQWRELLGGTDGTLRPILFEEAGSEAPALYLYGRFNQIGGVSSGNLARYGCEQTDCYADYDGNGSVNTADFIAYLNDWVGRLGRADCDDNGVVDTRDFVCFLGAWSAGC